MTSKRILLTVTNDLVFDQRMQRICTSLANAGYQVTLVGRKHGKSPALTRQAFQLQRIRLFFNSGFLFYAEYNLRLFGWLLMQKADAICAIDLDTILPVLFVSRLKGIPRVYDAHELFTEQKEIVTRPLIHKCWKAVERLAVPSFANGYTVNLFIKQELNKRYGVNYAIVRNLPVLTQLPGRDTSREKFIIYQGAVNEGRSFETLIPAMAAVPAKLVVCGDGNFFRQAIDLVRQHHLQNKIDMRGYVLPADLKNITPTAYAAVTLFEATGLNQYYSLSNRFFDYIMAGVPQVCVNYPEYAAINSQYEVALMVDDTCRETIALALNRLLNDEELYTRLRNNCLAAREHLSWQQEEKVLVNYWNQLLPL